MGNKSTVDPLLTPPPNLQVPKELIGSFEVSYIKNNEIVLRSLCSLCKEEGFENIHDESSLISLFLKSL